MFRPLADNILVEIDKTEKTESGIYLPEGTESKNWVGTVLAVGPGRKMKSGKTISPNVKVGDKVIVKRYVGHEVEIDGKECLILPSVYVLAKC